MILLVVMKISSVMLTLLLLDIIVVLLVVLRGEAQNIVRLALVTPRKDTVTYQCAYCYKYKVPRSCLTRASLLMQY